MEERINEVFAIWATVALVLTAVVAIFALLALA